MSDGNERDPRLLAIPDTHGHAKGEHKPFAEERPLPLTARMLFLWFYHACRRGYPRFLMVADHMNYLTFEDPAAVNLVRRALKLAQAGDLYGAAETANIDVAHAAVVSEGLRRGMRYSIGAEVDNDPRSRPDASNIVDAMRPDAIIRSVHFVQITHPVHGEGWHWPFDNPEFRDLFEVVGTEKTWELYVTALVDAIERLPGQIVGHFFVPAVFGHWPDDATLSAYEDRVLDAAASRQMAVEFNTRFLYRDHTEEEKQRYLAANKRFLRKAKARGVGIAIGSDAHSPKDQGGAFETVLAVLDELDINEIVFPLGGSLRRVALRVERKPEPEPPPATVEPPRAAAPAAGGEPGKTVRKARPGAKPSRAPETSPERPLERPEVSPPADSAGPAASGRAPAAPPVVPPGPSPDARPPARRTKTKSGLDQAGLAAPNGAGSAEPQAGKPAAPPAKPAAPVKAAAPPKAVAAKPGPAPKAPPAKAHPAKPAAVAKPAPVAKAGSPVKPKPGALKAPAGKAGGVKPAAAKRAVAAAHAKPKAGPKAAAGKATSRGAKAAPAARSVASKGVPAKGGAKKPAPKAAAHKPAAPKAAAKKAPATKKAAAKKPAAARPGAKKPAPKKAPAKRPAPARKVSPAKKTTAKKTATKRR